MDGVVLNGTMRDICSELKIDLNLFGNISVLEYQAIKINIAKYGVDAIKYYRQKADEERRNSFEVALAKQLGISVDELRIQLRGGANDNV